MDQGAQPVLDRIANVVARPQSRSKLLMLLEAGLPLPKSQTRRRD
jgi:hypothetical protein